MLASICSIRRFILPCVKFLSRALTALNLLPSIATLGSLNSSSSRHSAMNARHASPDRWAVVLAEVGDRLEVGRQPSGQPHQLDVALALALQPPARRDAIDIAVDVDLQHRRWMVAWPACGQGLNVGKAELAEIEPIHKDIDGSDRIVFTDVIIQLRGEQARLAALKSFNEPRHRSLLRITRKS